MILDGSIFRKKITRDKIINVDMTDTKFSKTDFSYSVISDSTFDTCTFTYINLSYCVCHNVKFVRCIFDFTDWVMCTFNNVVFEKCEFYSNEFLASIFDNVYLSGISKNRLIDCKFNETLKIDGNPVVLHLRCPESGAFIGYKECLNKQCEKVIVKLLIPEDAKRTSSYESKCRASYVKVLEIKGLDGTPLTEAYSAFDNTEYKVGEYVYPDKYDDSRIKVCTHGIHFFLSRQEAIEYLR